MKKLILLFTIIFPIIVFAQEEGQQTVVKKPTKYEEFVSKTGTILKYEDIKLPKISVTMSSSIHTIIRKLMGNPNRYFYGLTKNNEYLLSLGHGSAMIEYSDLVEINKAIKKIFSEEKSDKETKPYNLVNEFVTDDGFVIGYTMQKKYGSVAVERFIELERYGGRILPDDFDKVIEAFKEAQAKIEELMAKDANP